MDLEDIIYRAHIIKEVTKVVSKGISHQVEEHQARKYRIQAEEQAEEFAKGSAIVEEESYLSWWTINYEKQATIDKFKEFVKIASKSKHQRFYFINYCERLYRVFDLDGKLVFYRKLFREDSNKYELYTRSGESLGKIIVNSLHIRNTDIQGVNKKTREISIFSGDGNKLGYIKLSKQIPLESVNDRRINNNSSVKLYIGDGVSDISTKNDNWVCDKDNRITQFKGNGSYAFVETNKQDEQELNNLLLYYFAILTAKDELE